MYRINFYNGDAIFEMYAKKVYEGDLFGFVVIEDFVFGETTSLVIDPSEEKLRTEFSDVNRTLVPMQSVIRIDEVERHGVAKIFENPNVKNKVAIFPKPPGK